MRWTSILIFACLGALSIVGCEQLPEVQPAPNTFFGLVPIYADSIDGKTITTTGPVAITDGRSFAVLGDTLFIVDYLLGVHVINNSNPASPLPISFISIPGCTSVAINGNFLYVNNLTDLVTLDITNPLNAVVVDREENLYPQLLDYPEDYLGYFTCYDPSLGILTGWEEALISEPQCFIE